MLGSPLILFTFFFVFGGAPLTLVVPLSLAAAWLYRSPAGRYEDTLGLPAGGSGGSTGGTTPSDYDVCSGGRHPYGSGVTYGCRYTLNNLE